jgi:hypothetical protein
MIESFISRIDTSLATVISYGTTSFEIMEFLLYDLLFHPFTSIQTLERIILFGRMNVEFKSHLLPHPSSRKLSPIIHFNTSSFTRFPSSSQILMCLPTSTPAGTALQNTKEESPPDNNSDILLRVSPLLLGVERNSDISSTSVDEGFAPSN